ncbi:MAG: TonB-dependent receptor [Myxococcota bacterium]|nr:TonB-dependent receptor [Myxococcota bacterium]
MSERFVLGLPQSVGEGGVCSRLVRPSKESAGERATRAGTRVGRQSATATSRCRLVLGCGALFLGLMPGVASAQNSPAAGESIAPKASSASYEDAQLDAAEFEPIDESEEDEFDSLSGIETIEISGKRGQAVDMDTAESVTAFDSADLDALGVSDISDISQVTPNLEIRVSGATSANFFIRGVGLADFSANAASAVAIYQDGVALNSPAIQIGQIFDVEGIEVLRGPQGGGSGRNATAGAIKIFSRKPTGNFAADLKTTTGRYQSDDARNALIQSYEGAIEMPIIDDELSTRMAFRLQTNDPYQYNGCGDLPAIPTNPPPTPGSAPPGRPLNQIGPVPFQQFSPKGTYNSYRVTELLPAGVSLCGRLGIPGPRYISIPFSSWIPGGYDETPAGLPSAVGDKGNWGVRNQIRYQPLSAVVDMDFILNMHGGRVDQQSTLGQAIGTSGFEVAPGSGWGPGVGKIVSSVAATSFGGNVGRGENSYTERDAASDLVALFDRAAAARNIDKTNATDADPLVIEAKNEAVAALQENLSRKNPLDSGPYRGDYNRVGQTKLDTWGTSLNGKLYFDSVELHWITGYEGYDRFRETDQDFTSLELFEAKLTDSAWQFSQEAQVTGEADSGLFNWTAGGYFLYEDLEFRNQQFISSDVVGEQVWVRSFEQETTAFAFNTGFSWEFVEDLILEVGARYNWESKNFSLFIDRNSLTQSEIRSETWKSPTGTVSLTYRVDDAMAIYWKYGHGFKAGHFNSIDINDPPADSESIDAIEAGFRGVFLDSRLSMDGAIFYYEYNNYQVFLFDDQPSSPPSLAIKNAAETEQYGAEFNFTAEPLRDLVADEWSGLAITGRFSWLQSRFLDFTNPRTTVSGNQQLTKIVDYSGNSLPNSPNYKVSATVEWYFDLGSLGVVIPRYDFAWTDDLYFDPSNGIGVSPNSQGGFGNLPELTLGQPAYAIHNLRLSYRNADSNAEVSLWVRNLTDQRYKSYAFDATSFNAVILNFVGEPRSFGIDFALNF